MTEIYSKYSKDEVCPVDDWEVFNSDIGNDKYDDKFEKYLDSIFETVDLNNVNKYNVTDYNIYGIHRLYPSMKLMAKTAGVVCLLYIVMTF